MGGAVYTIGEKYRDYLQDESGFTGHAESISFPENEDEIRQIIRQMQKNHIPVTIQGGRTGIVGSGIPVKGHILNMTRMNKIKNFEVTEENEYLLTVEAGITLQEAEKYIQSAVKGKCLFWPPAPTEGTATIGGILASNASGIHRAYYGETAAFIHSAVMITAGGKRLTLDKPVLKQELLGTEGMTGVITEVTLELLKQPEEIWGLTFFFEHQDSLLAFLESSMLLEPVSEAFIAAIEFMDKSTIHLIQSYKPMMSKIKDIPDIEDYAEGLVYVELFGTPEAVEILAEQLMERSMIYSSHSDGTWAVSGPAEIERMRDFRHAAAEASNMRIKSIRQQHPAVKKTGTDVSCPKGRFSQLAAYFMKALSESPIAGCMFGHVRHNHFHINLFPQNAAEYETARLLIEKWTAHILSQGGRMSTEHGIGKLKRDLYLKLADQKDIECTKKQKHKWDPDNLWNPENRI